ncbi:D-alanyl-D-alanine carboxypeptidase DacC [Usitatibacter rugosus]|uniref:serine-type D-Ala-D-Ala carboxypeptidase n=1 Tax=Usitatibacter rugosus TaxID=2732067 RepID=A0A6M4H2W5_9PROT|nr:D-alanyl-D-alanine carboxypeptidase family protein [Usitatibacter rugosus]QJR13063.1 D-alanyl-D-alanine carboxypeptidase DacC [Usitatibacter rugosus]
MLKRLAVLLAGLVALSSQAQGVAPPPIAARAFVLLDVQSGQVLSATAGDDRFEPASLTKLMSAYLVFSAIRDRKLDPAATVNVSERAWKASGSRMFIEPNKPVTTEDLLRGMVVQSGNDATIALAEAVAGTEEAFVALMNKQAQKMGLTSTAFMNSTGMPAAGHHASARDLATLAAALIRDFPDRYPLYSQKDYTWNRITQANRNRLLWIDPTVDGMKSGFTEAAGYCLVASAKRGERRLISVVMGAQSDVLRMTESQKLLNFGFQAYETRLLYKKNAAVGTPEIFKGTKSTLSVGFKDDVWLSLPRDKFTGLQSTLETKQPFVAPFAAGEKAGIMKLTRDNAKVADLPVVALEDVPVAGFLSRGWDTLRLLLR